MNGRTKLWPPLIVAEHVSRLVRLRDVVLTAVGWGFLAALLDKEFGLFLGRLSPDWPLYFARLKPFLLIAGALAIFIVISALRTLRRAHRTLVLPQPAPLEAADEARRVGVDAAALAAARDRGVVVVHIDAAGRYRIEAR